VQSWEDKNGGGNRSKVVIVLTDMVMLDGKPTEATTQPTERPQAQSRPNTQPSRQPARNVPQTVDSSEDFAVLI
jgi:single-stranded DNA-binding protein